MDTDKDGIITASDLKVSKSLGMVRWRPRLHFFSPSLSLSPFQTAFTNVGKSISDSDASNMLAEAPGPVNFTQLVTLFAQKMAGGGHHHDKHTRKSFNLSFLLCYSRHRRRRSHPEVLRRLRGQRQNRRGDVSVEQRSVSPRGGLGVKFFSFLLPQVPALPDDVGRQVF